MNPVQCPDCECYETGDIAGGAHFCEGCGMIWSPRKSEEQYSLDLEVEVSLDRRAQEDVDSKDPEFNPCPMCSSNRIVGLVDYSGDLAGRYFCQACSCEFTVHESDDGAADDDDDEEEIITGVISVCPHCAAANSIVCYGDNEWCEGCWLDPNDPDQESPAISTLFKGGIKHALERDVPMSGADKPLGKFIRQECGPHCTFAEACPQSLGNLIKCFREGIPGEKEDGESVGKRKRGKKRKGRRRNEGRDWVREYNKRCRAENKKRNTEPPKVAFFCSKGGLLEKIMYGITDPDTEQPGNTGSQSGA